MGRHSDVDIRVVEQNGVDYPADVLVLKHAQALYGLDAEVAGRLDLDLDLLPKPDGFRKVEGASGIAAAAVVFVGVRPIREFTYADIRQFGFKALCSVASAFPDSRDIALTLHGVGYGLDELACLQAEVAGIHDAIDSDDLPRSLETVTFLEINPGRASRIRGYLESVLDQDELDAAGLQADRKDHAFIAMPFDESFSDHFHYGISNAVHANGLLCERIDKQAFVGDILQRMKDQIRRAKVMVADLSGNNANVFLEVGFAWGNDIPTILVCDQNSELSFDVQGQKCLKYKSIQDLEEQLDSTLRALLPRL